MLDSYKFRRKLNNHDANPRNIMLNSKKAQINYLYDLAADRVDDALLNGRPFKRSPRIFDDKTRDSFHYRVIIETVDEEDFLIPGDYVSYNGETWLCLEARPFHGLYSRGTFQKCNWLLRWQDMYTNEIHEYWCIDENSTQYNSGEMTNKSMVFKMGSAQHILTLPYNKDTIILDTPQRFFLDRSNINPTIYKVTQNDNSAYSYNGKGLVRVTVVQDQYDREKDNMELGICDYVPVSDVLPPRKYAKIVCDEYTIKSGGSSRMFKARFINGDDIDDSAVPKWKINCQFKNDLNINVLDDTLYIYVNNDMLVGSTFLLELSDESQVYEPCKESITVTSIY